MTRVFARWLIYRGVYGLFPQWVETPDFPRLEIRLKEVLRQYANELANPILAHNIACEQMLRYALRFRYFYPDRPLDDFMSSSVQERLDLYYKDLVNHRLAIYDTVAFRILFPERYPLSSIGNELRRKIMADPSDPLTPRLQVEREYHLIIALADRVEMTRHGLQVEKTPTDQLDRAQQLPDERKY